MYPRIEKTTLKSTIHISKHTLRSSSHIGRTKKRLNNIMNESNLQSEDTGLFFFPSDQKNENSLQVSRAAPPLIKERRRTYFSNLEDSIMIPEDVLNSILLYLQASELEYPSKYINRSFRRASNSIHLWRELCRRTGKLTLENDLHFDLDAPSAPDSNEAQSSSGLFALPIDVPLSVASSTKNKTFNFEVSPRKAGETESSEDNYFKKLYKSNPCVPADCKTIQEAVDNCQPGQTITILPGLYFEQIKCIDKKGITIRAAFPHIGAALIHHSKSTAQSNTSTVLNCDEPGILVSGNSSNITVSHLQALHSSPGIDIWEGNCVVLCENSATLHLHQCSLQSDSGRGVVVTGGSKLVLSHCVVHDCAATGLYVGDIGSFSAVYDSFIIENGFGSGRLLNRRRRRTAISAHFLDEEEDWSSDEEDNEYNNSSMSNNEERRIVPPGHSGIYIETAKAIIHDTMISRNCLTGLSVVRRGNVQLSGSDVTGNGAEPVTVEDIPPARGSGNGIHSEEGGIFMGPKENNFKKIINDSNISKKNALRDRISSTLFSDTIHNTVNHCPKEYMCEYVYQSSLIQLCPYTSGIHVFLEVQTNQLSTRYLGHDTMTSQNQSRG